MVASAPRIGKGASAGRSGWPMRPDVVVTEQAVDAGGDRRGRGGERLVGRVAERRQHRRRSASAQARPGAHGQRAARPRRRARRRRPGRSPPRGRRSPALDQLGEGGPGRVDEEVARLHQPAAEHEALRVEHGGQVGQAEADPPADLVDDLPAPPGRPPPPRPRRPRPARSRDRRRRGGPPRPAARPGPPRGPGRRARRPRRSAPSSRAARTGTAGPAGSTTMWPISPAKPAAPTCTRPSSTMPPPMPVPERDHDDVVEAAGGAEAVLGQDGEVGVVLDEHGAAGQPVADELDPVDALGLRQVGGEAEPALRGRPCRARRRRPGRPGIRVRDLGQHAARSRSATTLGHGLGDVAADDVPGAPSGSATRASATMSSAGSRATPRTLVPPMSIP